MLGIQPCVVLVAESFLALPFLVSGTDRVGLVHERLARRVAAAADVRVLPCPFEAAPVVEALWWPPMHDHDAGHRWLRDVFADVARRLPPI
jgi:DNA-binding transcriptional LysR family regulator